MFLLGCTKIVQLIHQYIFNSCHLIPHIKFLLIVISQQMRHNIFFFPFLLEISYKFQLLLPLPQGASISIHGSDYNQVLLYTLMNHQNHITICCSFYRNGRWDIAPLCSFRTCALGQGCARSCMMLNLSGEKENEFDPLALCYEIFTMFLCCED